MDAQLLRLKGEALEAAQKATCPRARCGVAIFTLAGELITGHNGHLGETTCILEGGHCVSSIHAELAGLLAAARQGVKLLGATVVSAERPCQRCLLAMKAAGILKCYYVNDYHSHAHSTEFCSPLLMEDLGIEELK
jgi:dCMP deaminase